VESDGLSVLRPSEGAPSRGGGRRDSKQVTGDTEGSLMSSYNEEVKVPIRLSVCLPVYLQAAYLQAAVVYLLLYICCCVSSLCCSVLVSVLF
jgi:hypothetical protein